MVYSLRKRPPSRLAEIHESCSGTVHLSRVLSAAFPILDAVPQDWEMQPLFTLGTSQVGNVRTG